MASSSTSSSSPKHEPETMGDNGHGKISSSSSNASDYEVIPNSEFYGHPVQIVKVTDERKFELDVEALGNILLRDSIRDTPVVVVSIAGDFRKGKSARRTLLEPLLFFFALLLKLPH